MPSPSQSLVSELSLEPRGGLSCPEPARPAALWLRPQVPERAHGHVMRRASAGLSLSLAPTPEALASNLNGCILED